VISHDALRTEPGDLELRIQFFTAIWVRGVLTCFSSGSSNCYEPVHFSIVYVSLCCICTVRRATIAIAALAQAVIVKLYKLRTRNLGFRLYHRRLIEENKWRAARWGLDGKLVDFGRRQEVAMRDLALELLEFIDDVVDELGSRGEVDYVRTILRDGTSADRQLRVFRETGDLRAVVRAIVEETRDSVEQSARAYHV